MRSGSRTMAAAGMLTVVLVVFFSSQVSSLFFYLRDTEQTCLLHYLRGDTQLLGFFRARLFDDQDFRIDVVARDPDHELVLSQTYGSQGSFRLTSKKGGKHEELHLDMRAGGPASTHHSTKLTELQLRVQQLRDLVQQVQQGQEGQEDQRV